MAIRIMDPLHHHFSAIEDDMERALDLTDLGKMKGMELTEGEGKAMQGSHPNPLIANFEKRNKQGTIEYHLHQVKNANLKWRELPSAERHAYCERYLGCKMKYEYLHDDRDVFVDYSWERTLSIYGDVYPEWCLEFFSTMYFDKGVDRIKLMTEKCIWFRLCGVEKVLTLLEFAVLLGLYEEDELNHGLFAIHFTKLEVDDKLFNHEAFWQKIGKPTSTNPRTSLIKEPLMRIVHKLLVGSLVHRAGSKERCQKRDMWIMSALEDLRGINLAWVIAEHLCKHALGLKENSLICGGHYVTNIAHSLGYLNEEEVAKCLEPIEYETWTVKMLANELDEGTHTLMQTEQEAPQPGTPSFGGDHYRAHGDGYHVGSIVPSSGYKIRGSSAGFHREDFDTIVYSEDYVESDDDEVRD
ncbi:hypothetical protein Tco_1563990 [Tanacetum coccineum]